MKVIYIDESGTFNDSLTPALAATDKRRSLYFVLSALIIDLDDWEKVFGRFKKLRSDLRHNYNIKKSEQIHAHELIGGSGVWRHIKYRHLDSTKRQRLLKYILTNYSVWPEVSVISVVVDKLSPYKTITPATAREKAYENLFNRIDKTYVTEGSPNEQYIVINDGQEDMEVMKILRRMRAFNRVTMSNGEELDIKIKGLVEDPFFKSSKNSYFLQCIDHIAYATLHVFDDRSHASVGGDILRSDVYGKRGISAVHRPTSSVMPGVVMVPSKTWKELTTICRKSLGA